MTTITENKTYQGQFGEFTITKEDKKEVIIYRIGLLIASLSFSIATSLIITATNNPDNLSWINLLFGLFSLGLGISLWKIHIYMKPLHLLLQTFWLIGTLSGLIFVVYNHKNIALFITENPQGIWGIGFIFAALTGIYFKEAFCFNRLETKILTPLVPFVLLGYLFHFISLETEKVLVVIWSFLFIIFVVRKLLQEIDPDIGDKSVFEYLKTKNMGHS
jgi:uncharacterized integral membrane protein